MKRRFSRQAWLPRGLALLALLGAATGAQAAEAVPEQHDVPIELARWIAPAARFLDSLPADLQGYAPPAGLTLLGSLDYGDSQRIVVASEAPAAQAQESLLRSVLRLNGWQELPDSASQLPLVFDTGPAVVPQFNSLRLCHDDYGLLSALPSGSGGLLVQRSVLPLLPLPLSACDSLAVGAGGGSNSALAQALPRLRLPAGASARMNSMSVSPGWTSQGYLVSGDDQPLAELLADFDSQLRAQGWDREASWAGEVAAGARLRLPLQGSGSLRGTLDILDLGAWREVKLGFVMEQPSAPGNFAAGWEVGAR